MRHLHDASLATSPIAKHTDGHRQNRVVAHYVTDESPAHDINPSIERQELTLAINDVETACDVSIAMEASQAYGLNPPEASDVLKSVQGAVAGWREEATRLNIPKAEQDLMAYAFPR